mmetsp:Transcript_89838/g.225939  ORF Transcript_89838/g.225939 Transcript_89838/m.225939 type:complete len:335 (-) Transcript_89838:276-1280(-)
MPHRFSADARSHRQQRAHDRGYVLPVTKGCSHIEVPDEILPAAKLICRSLATHVAHDALAGLPHHHARLATSAALAGGHIDEASGLKAWQEHRAASRAKHDISKHNVIALHPADAAAGAPTCSSTASTTTSPPTSSRDLLREAGAAMFELYSDDEERTAPPDDFPASDEDHIIDAFLGQCSIPATTAVYSIGSVASDTTDFYEDTHFFATSEEIPLAPSWTTSSTCVQDYWTGLISDEFEHINDALRLDFEISYQLHYYTHRAMNAVTTFQLAVTWIEVFGKGNFKTFCHLGLNALDPLWTLDAEMEDPSDIIASHVPRSLLRAEAFDKLGLIT